SIRFITAPSLLLRPSSATEADSSQIVDELVRPRASAVEPVHDHIISAAVELLHDARVHRRPVVVIAGDFTAEIKAILAQVKCAVVFCAERDLNGPWATKLDAVDLIAALRASRTTCAVF